VYYWCTGSHLTKLVEEGRSSRKVAGRTLLGFLAFLFTQLPGKGRLFSVILAHLVYGVILAAFYRLKCSHKKRQLLTTAHQLASRASYFCAVL
jgi:hypothetical protein